MSVIHMHAEAFLKNDSKYVTEAKSNPKAEISFNPNLNLYYIYRSGMEMMGFERIVPAEDISLVQIKCEIEQGDLNFAKKGDSEQWNYPEPGLYQQGETTLVLEKDCSKYIITVHSPTIKEAFEIYSQLREGKLMQAGRKWA